MKKLLLSFVAAFAVQLGISSAFAGDANDTTLINVDFNNITLNSDSVDYNPLWGDAQGGSTVAVELQHWGIWNSSGVIGWQNYDLGENEKLETWGTVYRKTESDNYLKIESDEEVWRRLGKDSSSNKASLHDFGAVTIKMKTQFSAAASDATGELDPQDKISVWVREELVAEPDTYENKLIVSAADNNGNAKDYVIDTDAKIDLTNLSSTWYALEIKPVAGNKFEVYIGEGEGSVKLSSNGTTQFPSYSNTGLKVNGDQNSELDDKISVVGFKGTGSIDDLVFESVSASKLTLAWDEGVASYTIGQGQPVSVTAAGSVQIDIPEDRQIYIAYEYKDGYGADNPTKVEVEFENGVITVNANAANPSFTINTIAENYIVNGVKYESLAEALARAGNGGEIKLNRDVVIESDPAVMMNGQLFIENKALTIDLNGQTITNGQGANPDFAVINVGEGGTLLIKDSSDAKTGRIVGSVVKIMDEETKEVQEVQLDALFCAGGLTTIEAGIFDSYVTTYDPTYLVIKGGKFKENGSSADFDLGGSVHGDFTYQQDVGEYVKYVKVVEATPVTYVAQIGEGEGAQKFETLDVAIEKAQDGDTVKLLNDVTLAEKITVKKAVTLDLNGCTLSETVTDSYGAIYIGTAGNLTITDSATDGKIATDGGIVIGNYGTVTVEGGTIEAGAVAEEDTSVYNFYYNGSTYGKLTVTGGKVGRIWNCGNANITAGEVVDIDNSGAMTIADAVTVSGTVIIKDGSDAADVPGAGTLAAPESLTVQVGTEGAEAFYVDGKWLVQVVVATIGEDKFASLEAAIAAAGAEDEVVVIADIATDAAFEITKKVAINLNGKTIATTTNDTEGNGVFWVKTGGDLTLNGDGTVNGVGGNAYNIAIWADGGKVTINDGTYTNVGAKDDGPDGAHFDLIYAKNDGSVEINGGTFKCETPKWTLNSHDTKKGTIVVKGGTFYDFDPSNCTTEGPGTNWCADGLIGFVDETVEGVNVYGVAAAVAQVGEAKFVSLEAAIAAPGAEIKLLANIDAEASIRIAKKVTIDLNGYTIKSVNTNPDTADGVFYVAQGGELTIEATNGGTVDGGNACGYEMAVWANKGGKVIINGGTFQNGKFDEADTQYDLIYARNGGAVVINGGTFKCSTPVWTLNNHNTEKGSITVCGGTFVGEAANPAESGDKKENFCALGFGSTYADGKWTVAKNAYIVTLPEAPANTSWKVVSDTIEITGDENGVYLVPMSDSSVKLVAAEGYEFEDKFTEQVIVETVSEDITVSAEGLPTVTKKQTDIWADVKDEAVDGVTAENKEAVNEALGAIATALGATSGSEAATVSAWITKVYPENGQISAATLISAGAKANLDVSIAYDLPLMEALPEVSVAAATSTSGKAAFKFELKDVAIQAAAEKAKDLIKFAQNLKGENSAFGPVGDNMTITIDEGKLKAEFSGKTPSGFATVDFTVPAK